MTSAIGSAPWMAQFEARFQTKRIKRSESMRIEADAATVRIGFLLGPRAAALVARRSLRVPTTDRRGTQRYSARRFAGPHAVARFWLAEVNRSFQRAAIQSRLTLGAVAELARDEARPHGPNPYAWLVDLFDNGVNVMQSGAAVETSIAAWAAQHRLNAVLVLLDWSLSRTKIEQGAWAGITPRPAYRVGRRVVFHPIAVADIRCALTAHTAAHEFGHMLGCMHEDQSSAACPTARAYAAWPQRYTVMAGTNRPEAGRRLEWSRPAPLSFKGERKSPPPWPYGNKDHNEAAWLRAALPLLAQQRFASKTKR